MIGQSRGEREHIGSDEPLSLQIPLRIRGSQRVLLVEQHLGMRSISVHQHDPIHRGRRCCQLERESESLCVRGPDDVLIGDHQPTPSTLLLLRHTCRWFTSRARSCLERLHNRLYWLLWTSVQKRSFEKRETKEKRGVHVCEVLETEPAWEQAPSTFLTHAAGRKLCEGWRLVCPQISPSQLCYVFPIL